MILTHFERIVMLVVLPLIMLLPACGSQPAPTQQAVHTASATPTLRPVTLIPTVAIASSTAIVTASPTVMASATVTSESASPTPAPSATGTINAPAALQPSPSPNMVPQRIDHYRLQRPIVIEDGRTHWVDRTYPYGSTQLGQRDVHLGVEFVNPRFTPVLAAAAGTVIYAGTDDVIRYGPDFDYYGRLVVLQHDFQTITEQPVYTLYGHLQDTAVQTGDRVAVGERIGRVGDAGIAIGSHLHFEVRVGNAQDYRQTRNPDLWIQPYAGYGTLAGIVRGMAPYSEIVILVRSDDRTRETYTYAGDRVNSADAWGENFTLGDLPAGAYTVIVSSATGRIYFREAVSITSSRTTWLEIDLTDTGYMP